MNAQRDVTRDRLVMMTAVGLFGFAICSQFPSLETLAVFLGGVCVAGVAAWLIVPSHWEDVE